MKMAEMRRVPLIYFTTDAYANATRQICAHHTSQTHDGVLSQALAHAPSPQVRGRMPSDASPTMLLFQDEFATLRAAELGLCKCNPSLQGYSQAFARLVQRARSSDTSAYVFRIGRNALAVSCADWLQYAAQGLMLLDWWMQCYQQSGIADTSCISFALH